jgi:hypothetical protein
MNGAPVAVNGADFVTLPAASSFYPVKGGGAQPSRCEPADGRCARSRDAAPPARVTE